MGWMSHRNKARGVSVFAVALFSPWASGWLSPSFGSPTHETRAMLLFHSRENARDWDGWVGII